MRVRTPQASATPCAKRAALQRKLLGGNRQVGTHAAVSKSPHIFASSGKKLHGLTAMLFKIKFILRSLPVAYGAMTVLR